MLNDSSIPDGSTITFLDADTLIVWPWADLSRALPASSDVGMAMQFNGLKSMAVVLIVKNDAARGFVKNVINEMTRSHAQIPQRYQAQFMGMAVSEQEWFCAMLESSKLKVSTIGSEWNENKFSIHKPSPRSFIYSWTGERFICKARGIEKRLPGLSFLLELFERDITEQEIVSCQTCH